MKTQPSNPSLGRDLTAGLVVFLVALPLCLGVALASNAPLFSGIIAGVAGGLIVGLLSGSPLSVSGPAAGLTAIVAAQIAKLGSFESFLAAVVIAGVLQILLGVFRQGFIAAFFPSSVIKGLLAAIGVILVLKQIPHVLGHDPDPEGEMSFSQPDGNNTFTEIWQSLGDVQEGALLIGLVATALLFVWNKSNALKRIPIPAPLIVVLLGIAAQEVFQRLGGNFAIDPSHLVQVPIIQAGKGLGSLLTSPDLNAFLQPAVYVGGFTIAVVASLETLLNLEAVDKLDPEQRVSPPNRELFAQGVGNVVSGLLGGLPVTSVIVRSSVNVNAGGKTKISTIVHGVLLALSVLLIPDLLNRIPLSALGAILLVTGLKLASPTLFRQMWNEGKSQFIPFITTVIGILLTDLLVGILIGSATSIAFILHSNARRPIRRIIERHASGDVLRIELANQVSYLSKAALEKILRDVPRGGHVLLDARSTDYIDPDVLDFIEDFRSTIADAHGVELSMVGFREMYPQFEDRIQYVDHTTRELQDSLSPSAVLALLKEGNDRFRSGQRLTRDFSRQVDATAAGQYPMAVVLSCIDSRTPSEFVFDLGLGDIFSVRVAGNVAKDKVLGSIEYACRCAGAKLVVVMGHSSCGAVNAAVDLFGSNTPVAEATGCENLATLIREIQSSVEVPPSESPLQWGAARKSAFTDGVSRKNVAHTIAVLRDRSTTLRDMERNGEIAIVGAFYDIATGLVSFIDTVALPHSDAPKLKAANF